MQRRATSTSPGPLSAQGHPVGQRGARTGVAIDTFMGRFSMLPNKRPSRTAARDESAASEVSTPRRIAGSGVRRFTTAAPFYSWLSPHRRCLSLCTKQLDKIRRRHGGGPRVGRGGGLGHGASEVRMSEHERAALEFMCVAVARYGNVGQPPWPVALSSLYGAFLADGAKSARIIAITFDASVDGWGP
jgi:hypothetical protein